ncbi:hypothetical protein [Geodermatophilus sp. SYSU D01105]
MKASVPAASVATLSVGSVDVREVAVGPLEVGRLVLDAVHVDLSSGTAVFRDLRVTVDLDLQLDWRVTIRIPLAGSYGWGGTVKMGSHSLTVGLGDVEVPGLRSADLVLPTTTVEGVRAVVGPLRDLRLGPLVAEQLRLRGVTVPVPDFTLTGLGVGRIGLTGLGIPGAAAADATVERLHGQALPLGQLTIPDLRVPEASAGRVTTGPVDAFGTANPVRFVADAGVLTLTLRAVPGARIRVRELVLDDLRTGLAVGALELHDVVLPYEVLGLTLSDLGIDRIDVPTIEVV